MQGRIAEIIMTAKADSHKSQFWTNMIKWRLCLFSRHEKRDEAVDRDDLQQLLYPLIRSCIYERLNLNTLCVEWKNKQFRNRETLRQLWAKKYLFQFVIILWIRETVSTIAKLQKLRVTECVTAALLQASDEQVNTHDL